MASKKAQPPKGKAKRGAHDEDVVKITPAGEAAAEAARAKQPVFDESAVDLASKAATPAPKATRAPANAPTIYVREGGAQGRILWLIVPTDITEYAVTMATNELKRFGYDPESAEHYLDLSEVEATRLNASARKR